MTKIVFFGTPRFAQIVLEKLIDSPYKPRTVITAPDAKVGRGQQLQATPVKLTAQKNNIEVLTPNNLNDLQFPPSDLAILVAYGKIIPKNILQIPKRGFINVHPSLLPKYRGPSPIQTAILNGEEKTGVTIMLLDEEIDHGPVLAQEESQIDMSNTHLSLIEKLGALGADMLLDALPKYLDNSLKTQPQDHSQATLTHHISKQDGFADLENPPSPETFDRMVRAYFPWPTVWSRFSVNSKQLTVKFLPGNLIQPEGKKPMTVKEFLNGYPKAKELLERVYPTATTL